MCLFTDDGSGGHRRGGKAKKASKCVVERAKGLDHEFATPRVKSAAKSREAVLQLNNIVYTKDNLLRKAIVSMDHKMRNALVTRNNDFIKFVSACFPVPRPGMSVANV